MTAGPPPPPPSHPTPRSLEESRAIGAGGWLVTGPPPCPKNRATSPRFPQASVPRPARDSPPRDAAGATPAAARARRPVRPARAASGAHAPACTAATLGTSPRTPAASRPPTPLERTSSGTPCIACDPRHPRASGEARRADPLAATANTARVDLPATRRGGSRSRRRPRAGTGARWISKPPPSGSRQGCR